MDVEIQRQEFIEDLYDKYYDKLILFCVRSFSGSGAGDAIGRAEDCVQETFIRAAREYSKLKDHPEKGKWLFRTCINHMSNELHKFFRRDKFRGFIYQGTNEDEDGEDADAGFIPVDPDNPIEQLIDDLSYQDMLEKMYEMLLDNQHMIFDEYYVKENKISDIHDQHGMPIGTIKSILHRIRERLRKGRFD